MLELVSLLASPIGGRAFGMIGEMLSNSAQRKIDDEERKFRENLAFKDQLKDYLSSMETNDGKPTVMGFTLSFIYIVFSLTACFVVLWCFYAEFQYPQHNIPIKDPSDQANTFSLLGGAIAYSWNTHTITQLSSMGVGYLVLHPILFVLGLVSSGGTTARRK